MKDSPHSILLQSPWLALNGPHAAFADKCGYACVYKEGYGLFEDYQSIQRRHIETLPPS